AFSAFAFSISGESMTAEANIFADSISIEVPDYIFLGNISKGFANEKVKLYINNTGTTNVTITPKLEDSSEKIFNYTYFARRADDVFVQIGKFSLNIPKPSTFGGKRDEYCYIRLDLTNYPYSISNDVPAHKSNIIFWATAS
ncbi:MAG: hypothetical protein Q8L27_04350, partial [archaeon]|nr:hypothetical protein [archaeon]